MMPSKFPVSFEGNRIVRTLLKAKEVLYFFTGRT